MRKQTTIFLVFALIAVQALAASCGGGGGTGGGHLTLPTGGVAGRVYIPVGSEPAGRAAGASTAPPAGYKGLEGATVSVACGALTISKEGYAGYSSSVSVSPNTTTTVGGAGGVSMLPAIAGSVEITANVPGAAVFIDGEDTGLDMSDTELVVENLSAGNHTVTLKLDGFRELDAEAVTIQASAAAEMSFTFIPANEKIVFISQRDSDFVNSEMCNEIYIMNADGSDQTRLTSDDVSCSAPTGSFSYDSPSISADGKKVIFSRGVPGTYRWELYEMNTDGTGKKLVLSNPDYSLRYPAYSWDGKKIAFIQTSIKGLDVFNEKCLDFSCNEIFIADADGSNPIQVTDNKYPERFSVKFSPDGKKLVFASGRDGEDTTDYLNSLSQVYIINVDGTGEEQLTSDGDNEYPSFSADGKKVLFSRSMGMDVYTVIMNLEDYQATLLSMTEGRENEDCPSFSADGEFIAYESFANDDYSVDIYLMNSDGSERVKLTNEQGSDEHPSWTP